MTEKRIQTILADELEHIVQRLRSDECNISSDDALEIISNICNVSMSKEQSARYLNMPTSTFDKKVSNGTIPGSHKHSGITERLWYLRDLISARYGIFKKK